MMKNAYSHKNRGLVSIEFSMGFVFFMLIFFVWAQIAYMGYISGIIDYTIAETARNTRASIPVRNDANNNQNATYQTQFRSFLAEQTGIWGLIVNPDNFVIKTYHYDSIASLSTSCTGDEDEAEADCLANQSTGNETNVPIAVYQVSYSFNPLFNLFNPQELSLKREVFVVQEYERDKFYN